MRQAVKKNNQLLTLDSRSTNKVAKKKTKKKISKKNKIDFSDLDTSENELISINIYKEDRIALDKLSEIEAITLALTYYNESSSSYFKLGGVLNTMQSKAWYMDKGFEKFKDYVEQEVGIHYRRAMYLIKIYNGLLDSGIKFKQVNQVGWSKMKDLVEVLTKDNLDYWIEKAQTLNVLQLKEAIKTSTKGEEQEGRTLKEKSELSSLSFKVFEDQKEIIMEALEKAKHELGTESNEVALENICMGFLSGNIVSTVSPQKISTLRELIQEHGMDETLDITADLFREVNIDVEHK